MTLLASVLAAVISTLLWYMSDRRREMQLATLCWLYWGASIMWFVDAIFEYARIGVAYFTPAPEEMLNDLFLGISAVTFGLVIWLVVLLVKDPKGVVRSELFKKK